MSKESEWQKRYRKLFEHYVDSSTGEIFDSEFNKKIIELRKMGDKITERVSSELFGNPPIHWLMLEYKFPKAMYDFIVKYIIDDVIDYSLLRSGLYLVCPLDESAISADYRSEQEGWFDYTGGWIPDLEKGREFYDELFELKLVISNDATNEQIVDFIRRNAKYIKDKQKVYRINGELEGRVREPLNRKRDLRIKELVNDGITHKEAATIINKELPNSCITYVDVAKIIQRLKSDGYKFTPYNDI
ncbi:MAG: hypothetical protein PWQ10_134 [Patescibacteria group bacterium]|nr:hypothetical protein [Patescibacteria group bacterium]